MRLGARIPNGRDIFSNALFGKLVEADGGAFGIVNDGDSSHLTDRFCGEADGGAEGDGFGERGVDVVHDDVGNPQGGEFRFLFLHHASHAADHVGIGFEKRHHGFGAGWHAGRNEWGGVPIEEFGVKGGVGFSGDQLIPTNGAGFGSGHLGCLAHR